jgi:hypothetical protein
VQVFILSSFLKLTFALSKNPESKREPEGKKEDGSDGAGGRAGGTPIAQDHRDRASLLWRGLCGPAGLKRPAGAARENLQTAIKLSVGNGGGSHEEEGMGV